MKSYSLCNYLAQKHFTYLERSMGEIKAVFLLKLGVIFSQFFCYDDIGFCPWETHAILIAPYCTVQFPCPTKT